MNAKEARELLKETGGPGYDVSEIRAEAKGYLAALEGEEVKALVEALDAEMTHSKRFGLCNCPELRACEKLFKKSKQALSKYREAVKK